MMIVKKFYINFRVFTITCLHGIWWGISMVKVWSMLMDKVLKYYGSTLDGLINNVGINAQKFITDQTEEE